MGKRIFAIFPVFLITVLITACETKSESAVIEQNTDGDGDGEPQCISEPCGDDFDCAGSCICFEGECIDGREIRYDLSVVGSHLIYRNDTGKIDIYDEAGKWILRGGTAFVMLDETDETGKRFSVSSLNSRTVETDQVSDDLGNGDRLIISADGGEGEPSIVWRIVGYYDEGFYTFELDLVNDSDKKMQFAKASNLSLEEASGGGLYLGPDPVTHRILENGSYSYLDHVVSVHPGDVERQNLLATAIPGNFMGNSVSNWNHCIKDLESPSVWIAGGLSFNSASTVFNTSYDEEYSVVSPDGRAGFSYFSVEMAYQPNPKPVPAGESFTTEITYIHPSEANPFEGLENYATKVKQYQNIVLWHEREGKRIPNGWNSWSGSGGTGGYGTDINEDLMIANLDFMAEQFKDWGIDWFQIDDGYEPTYGDWTWREDRFPKGPRWMSDRIRERGLKPGLWMSPLALHHDSQTVADHPDWVAEKSEVGTFFSMDYTLFDLTNPEVQNWIRNIFRTFRQDWNFDWLKMDFAYHALFTIGGVDPSKTREEMYRNAVKIIREEIGDDTFFLAVGVMGIHFGLVDADRITLDSAPIWDWPSEISDTDILSQQGLKPTVRTSARRYYLHNRIWINHPDLIIFRSNPRDESWPRVTLEEAQAFCTYVGFSGGIVKIGDRLLDMTADHINSVRKLLPIYPKAGRPLDLFVREFPELWHTRVDGATDGYDEEYDLVGFINWGRNWDLSTNPYTDIPDSDQPKTFSADLVDLELKNGDSYLAYEFWTGTFLGEIEHSLELEVPAHASRVVAIRKKLERPQFLGWNRQITMGATDIKSMVWDGSAKTLEIRTKVAKPTALAPFTYKIAFYVPEGYSYSEVRNDLSFQTSATVDGNLLLVEFSPTETGELVLTIQFVSSQ